MERSWKWKCMLVIAETMDSLKEDCGLGKCEQKLKACLKNNQKKKAGGEALA
jgi:hypothetical protein